VNVIRILMIGCLSLAAPDAEREVVKGFGRTIDEAKLDARQAEIQNLKARLAAHDPPLTTWQPTLADVERLVQGPGRAGKSDEPMPGAGVHIVWLLPIRQMTEDEIVQRDRRAAREHQSGVAFLIVMTGLALGVAALALGSWRSDRRG
jgi:hypothetical protein